MISLVWATVGRHVLAADLSMSLSAASHVRLAAYSGASCTSLITELRQRIYVLFSGSELVSIDSPLTLRRRLSVY